MTTPEQIAGPTEADLAKTLEVAAEWLDIEEHPSLSRKVTHIANKLHTGKLIVVDHPQATSPVDEPINATDAAFMAGEAIYQRDGVSPLLREVMQLRKHNSAMPSLAAKDAEIARLRDALVEIQDARTDLNDRSDYARGWNESRWNFKKIARQALGDEA